MTSLEIENERYKKVVKANALIQKSRYELTALQQKVVLYLISKIEPYETELKECQFNIADFCKVCGIDCDSGGNYAMLKRVIKELADKSIWITLEDGSETLLRWIERPYIRKKSGIIKLKIDELMKPYLLQQKKEYTSYELIWALQLEKKYSLPLYELVKSIHYHELTIYERIYDLEELRKIMGAENYKTWQHFKERALEPAIEEINKYTNKIIDYEVIKYGRVVGRIKLKVSTKDTYQALKDKRV